MVPNPRISAGSTVAPRLRLCTVPSVSTHNRRPSITSRDIVYPGRLRGPHAVRWAVCSVAWRPELSALRFRSAGILVRLNGCALDNPQVTSTWKRRRSAAQHWNSPRPNRDVQLKVVTHVKQRSCGIPIGRQRSGTHGKRYCNCQVKSLPWRTAGLEITGTADERLPRR